MWNSVLLNLFRISKNTQRRFGASCVSNVGIFTCSRTVCSVCSEHNKSMNMSKTEMEDVQDTKSLNMVQPECAAGKSSIDRSEHLPDARNNCEEKTLSRRAIKRQKRALGKRTNAEERMARKQRKKSHNPELDFSKETSYYFENGLRKVYPYNFTFSTYAKGRWTKRKLLDIFVEEFKHYPDYVFKEKIIAGEVCVNNTKVGVDYVIKGHDYITHQSHRHEVPVTADPIQIIHESDDILVINKPSSIPCHPCGNFRHNSVIFILDRELGYKRLKFVHRIDRMTSGLLLMAKNGSKAAEITRQVADRLVEKEYVCRVDGEFPSGKIECRERLEVLSHKLGLQHVSSSGKDAYTTFERMSYNGRSSVVNCQPHTGRTHQIRVHLQYLGYPITNDAMYNNTVWGPQKGKGGDFGKSTEELIILILENHDKLKYVTCDFTSLDSFPVNQEMAICIDKSMEKHASEELPLLSTPDSIMLSCKTPETNNPDMHNATPSECPFNDKKLCHINISEDSSGTDHTESYPGFNKSKTTFDPTCLDCQRQFREPDPKELVMYLHALRYKGPDWEYSTPLPPWAAPDWHE